MPHTHAIHRFRRALALVPVTILALTTLVVAEPARADTAQTYYVDCSAGPGTGLSLSSPWNSLAAVNGHGAFTASERILFKRGTTCKGQLRPIGSGTTGRPIVVSAYGSGALPTIAGGGTAAWTAAVMLMNLHDWTISNLHITNRGKSKNTTTFRSGVMVLNQGSGRLGGITLTGLHINDVWSNPAHGPSRLFGGISVLTSNGSKDGFDNLTISKNTIDHVGRTGIFTQNEEFGHSSDRGMRITGNRLSHIRGDSIVTIGVTNARIDHNVSAHGGEMFPCPQCGGITADSASAAIWPAHSNNVRIDHNEVYGERAKGGDGTAFDVDQSAKNIVIEQNYAHDNQGGGLTICGASNVDVRFNIFEDNTRFATFACAPAAKNVRIYNNSIYATKGTNTVYGKYVVYVRPGHTPALNTFKGVKILNNVIYYKTSGYWRIPSSARVASNTLVNATGHGLGKTSGTSTSGLRLKKPGHGGTGMGSVSGYHRSKTQKRGVAIPSSAKLDFFGHRVNTSKPFRGASQTP